MTGKCPLCFMMTSSKDLYTVYIENVNQHCVGDVIEFMFLTRDKDSLTLTAKQKENAELAVRKAMSELDSWLARAESGLVDDLERILYVCAAMGQLEERNIRRKKGILMGPTPVTMVLFTQLDQAAVDELIDGQGEILLSSYEDNKGMQMPSDSFADKKMKGSYDFYQGTWFYKLSPLT
ncbi:putative RING-finger protein Mag2/Rnf10 [Helianthus anomalus]